MRRVLGIDPGSLYCGYGIVDVASASTPTYVECGVLQFEKNLSLAHRLHQLSVDLREIIQEFTPRDLALEAIFQGKNVQSAFRLGYARGIVMMLSAEFGLGLYEYPPSVVKRAVAGHGHARKEEIQRMVTWQCRLKTPPKADAADALAIALCHGFRQGNSLIAVHSKGKRGL